MSLDYTLTIPDWFKPTPSNCYYISQPISTQVPLSTYVDASTVTNWIQKFSAAYPRFEKIAANGLYPILEKEIQDITGILNEGLRINNAASFHSGVSSMIHELVRPRIAQLQTSYQLAQKKLSEHLVEKETDARLIKKWEDLGLPTCVVENHADCARFLIESGLAFTIVGFRDSRQNSAEHGIRLDPIDSHPLIKMQGRWVRWEIISQEIHYDAKSEKIKSRAYSGNLVQSWNYFHPQGLVPIDRFDYDQAFPIYELKPDEYNQVRQKALKFYETNPEKDLGIPKDCIVQFVTAEHRVVPKNALFNNAQRNYPVHVGLRLITADRKVYSFGFQLPPEEAAFVLSDHFSTMLTTAEAKIGMLDYEEFLPYNKLVTSIPLTAQRAHTILNFVNELKDKQLRFQYMRQNCSTFALEILQKAGYGDVVNLRTSFREAFIELFPSLNQIPIIAKIVSLAQNFWNCLPAIFTKPIEFSADVITYVPKKFGTILTNLLVWKMGGAKKTTPLQEGLEDEEFYDKKKIQTFSTLIRSWADLFRDETNIIYHSKYFIDWQKNQESTFEDIYSGRPKLAIVPPTV